MSRPEHPHTVLGESIREFAAHVQEATRRIEELQLPAHAEHPAALIEAAQALQKAAEGLSEARAELESEQAVLAELLEQERLRYRDLFEWAPDAYLVTTPAGQILEVNRAVERMFGYPRSILQHGLITVILPDSERAPFRQMLARLPSLELVSDWELHLRRKDGTTFPAAVTVAWLSGHGRRSGNLRWLVRDISERRANEQRMLAQNLELDRRVGERTAQLEAVAREKDEAFARLEAVLDQIPAAIVIADATSGRVVAANEHASRLVSEVVGSGEALDHWLSIGLHPDGRPYKLDERPIMQALGSGESVDPQPIEFQRLDGSHALYETSAAPIRNSDGDVVAAVAAYWDLTERERLARAEREFVTNAAHELRTPLAALASAVEVLQSGAKDDPRDRERFLTHIEQQSERLQRLVRSLLLLARLQTQQEQPEPESVPVDGLLRSVAALGPDRVRVEAGDASETSVLTNRDLVEQALLNLLSNADKYAPEGEIVLRSRTRNGYVALEVSDNGPGMTPEQSELAPLRFFRGRDDVDGFGLGLSIAKQAAEALGGCLELESDGLHGTTVRVLLPLARHDD